MLIQFSVSNFKSIKDKITLDMQATSITEHKEHLIGSDLLHLAVIYGPNGGGKSNVLQALNTICDKVISPIRILSSSMEIEYERIPFIYRNDEFELNINEESSGTQKLFVLLPRIIDSLSNGTTFVADELDAQLHPKLLEYIINLFTNPIINSNNAQLIFTSLDLSTMTGEIFRRDEIWFAAKNNEQATSLYSLVEIKNEKGKTTRKDTTYNKQYLEGRYGADPYLRRIINWEVKKTNG